MRIGIDGRFLGPAGTGIGRYTEKLLENLEILDKENEYFVFLKKNNFHLYNPKNPKFQKILADIHWYTVKEQLLLPRLLTKYKLDLVHFPQINIPILYKGKFVTTLHDLTKINFKDAAASTHAKPLYLAKHFAFETVLKKGLEKAEAVFVPSKFVASEINKKYQVPKEKLVVTYEGADDFLNENVSASEGKVKEVLARFSIKPPYLLYLGNTYPYKNLKRLLETLPQLDPAIKLVCVTKRDSFLEKMLSQADMVGIKNRLVVTGWVSDSDLKILFQQAQALVFPSLSEGFGLPGLEAMALGCPVISSNKSSLPEVYQDAAVYFDPYSTSDMEEKISSVLKSEKLRTDLKTKGLLQVKKYSWAKMAEDTLKIYKQVLKG